jgi:hypothetical protein
MVVGLQVEESLNVPAQRGPTQSAYVYLALDMDCCILRAFVEQPIPYLAFQRRYYQARYQPSALSEYRVRSGLACCLLQGYSDTYPNH